MKTHNSFNRKIFTCRSYFASLYFLISRFKEIRKAMRSKEVSRKFGEKIMLVTSAVNGCVYCEWFHAKLAVDSGVSKGEMKQILDLQFQTDASEFELPALLYAQHYAETDKSPDTKMERQLVDFYGEENAAHIKTYIEMIFLAICLEIRLMLF
jgi:AhpD family alkylhydroperoxidase